MWRTLEITTDKIAMIALTSRNSGIQTGFPPRRPS
jgi:hypothetical protein